MTREPQDWMWCYENPKEAAAKLDRLTARLEEAERERDGLKMILENRRLSGVDGGWVRAEAAEARLRELERALTEITRWPDGGNRHGQENIKKFARAALKERGT